MPSKRQNESQLEATEAKAGEREGLTRSSGALASSSHPFGLLRRFASEIDDLFSDFGFGRSPILSRAGMLSALESWPQIDMFESNGEFVIRADVPGLKKDDLKVAVTDKELTVSGERKDEREEHKGEFYRSERSYGKFERRIPLPEGANLDSISSTFKNGILEVRMKAPERPSKGARTVEIRDAA